MQAGERMSLSETALSFEEAGAILDEITETLPVQLFKELNGGVILLPDVKHHPESREDNGLLIIGEYRYEPRGLGRYIVIFFGSFIRSYGNYSPQRQKNELRRVLQHELKHHIQSLGGTRGLEKEDARQLERYRRIIRK